MDKSPPAWFAPMYLTICACFALGFLWCRARYRNRRIDFPEIDSAEILHFEKFGSASSDKFGLARANNCLTFTVTADELWISGWSPFKTFLGALGMEQRIRKADIERVVVKRFFWTRQFQVHCHLPDGGHRRLDLVSHKPEEFLAALRVNARFRIEEY